MCGPCRRCRAEADRMLEAFDRGVFFGEWDADGFTVAERRARDKRAGSPRD